MLIFEKINEINEILNSLNAKQEKFNAQEISILEQKFHRLKQDLDSTLQAQRQSLKNELRQDLNTLSQKEKESLQIELRERLDSSCKSVENEIKDSLQSLASISFEATKANLDKKYEQVLEKNLQNVQEHLKEQIQSDKAFKAEIKNSLDFELKKEVRQSVKDFDFSQVLEYQKMPLDYKKIGEQILDSTEFKQSSEVLEQNLKEQTTKELKEYLVTNRALKNAISEIGFENASEIFKEAIDSDELLKMRYETLLYLQSLKLYGLDKSLFEIAQGYLSNLRAIENELKPKAKKRIYSSE